MAAYDAPNGQWQPQRGFPYQHPHPQQQNNQSAHPNPFLRSPYSNGAGGYQTDPQTMAGGRGPPYDGGFPDAQQHPGFMQPGQPHNPRFDMPFSTAHDSSLADAITLPPRQTFLSTSPEPMNPALARSVADRMSNNLPVTPSSGIKRSRTDDSDANDGDKTKTCVGLLFSFDLSFS